MNHRSFRSFLLPAVLVGAALCTSSDRAEACGGFFCSVQQPVNQAAERIIFADNGDGTITAVIQIMYEGPSESFSWLLPISTVPQSGDLAVASDQAFARLQAATNPQYQLNTVFEGRCAQQGFANSTAGAVAIAPPAEESCDQNALLAKCSPAVTLEASGVVGQFAWSAISVDPAAADPAAPALEWLTQNGYDVTPEAAGLIGPYLADGMYLLALRLTKGSDIGSIRPLRLTYAAAAPMIPIKLTAVAANEDMGVMTWALSSARAVPFNYNALELNEARINWFNAVSNYDQVVTEAADEAGGQGFVTEFAGPSGQLAQTVWTDSEEMDWQTAKTTTYFGFNEMFQAVYYRYQNWSGFWDAVRRVVVLPETVSFEDFKQCPGCFSQQLSFSPTEFFAALEADVIEPMRSVQTLIDRTGYATRLYSTLSASEMISDPVFVFNPDLPDVNNLHRADRVVECGSGLSQGAAPWRIEFPQGSVIRGTAQTVGLWPAGVVEQPANFRVLSLSTSGEGRVVEDNASEISLDLSRYNASLPDPGSNGSTSSMGNMSSRGGFCTLAAGPRPSRSALPLAVAVAGLLGAGAWRRRRSAR